SVLLWPLRRALEMREEQRFTWERVLARQRVMLRDAAAFLATRGQLARRDDIWFLEWDEFRATLVGGATPDHRILTLRRHTARVEARFAKPPYIGPRLPSPEISDARVISGIGASPGAARGTVRVFAGTPTAWTPMTDHEETIAVLQALDPAWTILLPHVAGVVLERGGLLSHAALLAREYGVPMVVGVENATRLLRDGLEVTVDGVAGRVIVHDEDPAVSGDAPPEA
ncbi:MAG TPA: PEP-utilizing enzyme, partial [Candidatus Hydrogenedentes bacterium]|nr:PEP-utilizing enzyme [Candidatus Hydrogenedentota bacterium]